MGDLAAADMHQAIPADAMTHARAIPPIRGTIDR